MAISDVRTSMRDAVRTFNKYVLNPAMVHLAGRKHWYASLVQHTGRHSHTRCFTPVVADRTGEGFLIPLPYGTDVDWLRNVQAAGKATIISQGSTFDVVTPEVVDAVVAAPKTVTASPT